MKKSIFCNQFLLRKTLMLFAVFFTVISLNANNVQITNIVNTNPGSANPEITFDIKWDNSGMFHRPNNYDAV